MGLTTSIASFVQYTLQPTEQKLLQIRESIQKNFQSFKNLHNNTGLKENKIKRKLMSDTIALEKEEKKYDLLFEEEEALRQQNPIRRKRHQTLQEFVILFFYVSFGILVISLCMNEYQQSESFGSTIKTFALMLFLALCGTVFMIRYG